MAHLVHLIGMYDGRMWDGDYYWLGADSGIVWLKPNGEVNIDLIEVEKAGVLREAYYGIIGWCVSQRIPCVLHGETVRRAWRP
jgi:hypothetical protein